MFPAAVRGGAEQGFQKPGDDFNTQDIQENPSSNEIGGLQWRDPTVCQDPVSESHCSRSIVDPVEIRYKYRKHIVYCLENYQITILATEVGVNNLKLPQYLLELDWHTKGYIGVLEPNTDPTLSYIERVHLENVNIDSEESRIKHFSEESLLRELFSNPLLIKYGVIIYDKVCRRSVLTDTILALLKKILRKSGQRLKLILVSNVNQATQLADYFQADGGTKSKLSTVLLTIDDDSNVSQRVHYLEKPCPNYMQRAVETVLNIHREQPIGGDIIVYLVSEEEASEAIVQLRNYLTNDQLKTLNCIKYCQTNSERRLVFFPKSSGQRNVIFTTALYQGAVAQDCIDHVIDCGFMQVDWFRPEKHFNDRFIVPVCQYTALQRSKWWRYGRFGSTGARVYRLYTREQYESLAARTLTEMRRTDLCGIVLYLKALAVDSVLRFDFPSPPPAKNLLSALETLYALEALNADGQLNGDMGYFMAAAPLSAKHSRLLYKSQTAGFECSEEILSIVAMLLVEPIFIVTRNNVADAHRQVAKRAFETKEGDHLTLLNVYTAFVANDCTREFCQKYYLHYRNMMRVRFVRRYLQEQLLAKHGLSSSSLMPCVGDSDAANRIVRCIAGSYFLNVAYLDVNGAYKDFRSGATLYVDRDSSIYNLVQPKFLVYDTLANRSGKTFMRYVTVIDETWLPELAPHYYKRISHASAFESLTEMNSK